MAESTYMPITDISLQAAYAIVGQPIEYEAAATIDQYYQKLQHLLDRLSEFLCSQPVNDNPISETNKLTTYTDSADYLKWVTGYHHASDLARFVLELSKLIIPSDRVLDVGCASGFSGLALIQYGRPNITFYDYEGLGLRFLRWMIEKEEYTHASTVPYGNPIEKHNWAIAMDVLEHTGNHLAFLKWLSELADKVALCYPVSVPFHLPYQPAPIDEWVDDEAIQWTIARRHKIIKTYITDGRRYTIYKV